MRLSLMILQVTTPNKATTSGGARKFIKPGQNINFK
jgi:hypothetical protein